MEEENKLPNGWVKTKLADITIITLGQSPPSESYNFDKIGLPFYQGKTEFGEIYPIPRKWCSKPNKIAKQGDILLSVRAPVGSTNICPDISCIGRGLAAIRGLSGIKTNFLFYLLRGTERTLSSQSTGTTFDSISGDILKKVPVLLPPYNEQLRIVEKIEELFSELDNGIQNLIIAQEQLKIYRQSVLKHAFEGKLSQNHRLNYYTEKIQNKICEIPKSGTISDSDNLPEEWKWVKLGEVIEQPKYGTSKKCDYNLKGKAVLRIPNISNGFINNSDLKFAEFDNNEIETFRLKEGDLLIIRSNGSVDLVGKCSLITKRDENYLFAGYLIRLRPIKEIINSKYLLNILSSSKLRVQIESKAKSTSGVNNINSDELKSLIIPIPPTLEEQNQIVQEIESRLSVVEKLEQTIEENIKKADSLRQSILKKAFEGKLVPQDPNDEPASLLLDKIKNEPVQLSSSAKKKVNKEKSGIAL